MADRLPDDRRLLMALVRAESRRLGHDYIGTGHLLLGLLRAKGGHAIRALEGLAVDRSAIRRAVEALLPAADGAPPHGQLPFTPRAMRALDLSLEEASSLGHARITSAHLLLGLLRVRSGAAGAALAALGVHLERVRERLS